MPLFTRHSNGFWKQNPTYVSRQYELSALCCVGRYLYTGSHLGFKKWDIGIESDPIDVTKELTSNKYLQKNQYIEQWSINPWGTGGGERIPYKMAFYNGYIYAIARSGSGFVADDSAERAPNTNIAGEVEVDGTVGYFIILDTNLNIVFKKAYYGTLKSEIGYRKPSGFVIDEATSRIFISCQLYGWICYDISNPNNPVELFSYSPLNEDIITSINGADLSSRCGPIEYQNGCIFSKDGNKYYACAGYVDGVHLWNINDISAPFEIKNDIVSGNYGIFWQFRIKEAVWNTFAHVFDVEVLNDKMYLTIAPTTNHANDESRIAGLVILDIENIKSPKFEYIPISQKDWNNYNMVGDVKPSHLIILTNKIVMNNGDKGIAVFDITGTAKYRGCISSDGDDIYQMVTNSGRFITGSLTAPYNFRIIRGLN